MRNRAQSCTDSAEWFETVWNEYYPRLIVFCRNFAAGLKEDAEDLVQEILIKVYEKHGQYDRKYPLKPWIYRIARNHCIDRLRKKKIVSFTRQGSEDNAPDIAETLMDRGNPGPEATAVRQEELGLVREFMEGLESIDRTVAFLRFFEDMKYAEISRITNLPLGTIKYKIHDVKNGLSEFLDKKDFTYEQRRKMY